MPNYDIDNTRLSEHTKIYRSCGACIKLPRHNVHHRGLGEGGDETETKKDFHPDITRLFIWRQDPAFGSWHFFFFFYHLNFTLLHIQPSSSVTRDLDILTLLTLPPFFLLSYFLSSFLLSFLFSFSLAAP